MPLVLGFVALLGGVVLLTSGITDASFADVIQGHARVPASSSTPTANSTPAGTAGAAGATVGATAGMLGNVSLADLARRAAARGWSVTDWIGVIKIESGGRLTAQNPSSPAFGIAQGITGPDWYYTHGGNPDTVSGQLDAMENYIASTYGNPTNALAHEHEFGWY